MSIYSNLSLSKDIVNIIAQYTLPSNEYIMKLKIKINYDLEFHTRVIHMCLSDNIDGNGKHISNINDTRYIYLNYTYFTFWSLRMKT